VGNKAAVARTLEEDSMGKKPPTAVTLCRLGLFISFLLMLGFFSPSPDVRAQTANRSEIISPPSDRESTAAPQPWQMNEYIIGPEDVLRIDILDVDELSHQYPVSNRGTIYISILSAPVVAAGLTIPQFTESLSKELKDTGMLADPHITITVTESKAHSVAVTGAVKKPQVYQVFSQTTLLDVLSQAEGLADDASSVAIVRRGDIAIHILGLDKQDKTADGHKGAALRTVTVDLKTLMENSNPGVNVAVYPGDRITVPRAGIVYVVGAVNKPGGFAMRSNSHGITALQALALAQDTKPTALSKDTVIIRTDSDGSQGRKQIPVDLKKVIQGKSPDPMLQAEDILFVPDSAGKRALRRGVEAALQITSGALIYSSRF
jgi:polysaccharide biosynthesis/export protein